jgi:hypothetical protein
VEDVHAAAQKKKLECLRKKYENRKGDKVILRDVFDKILTWIDKFRAIGDIAVQYDPAHAALPWAGIRFFLQVWANFHPP